MTVQRNIFFVILGLLVAVFIFFGAFWGLVAGEAYDGKIFDGVTVRGVSLSGMSRDEAVAKIRALEAEMKETSITFTLEGHSWPVTLAELGFRLDAEGMADRAFKAGRSGFVVGQWLERRRLEREGREIGTIVEIDRARMEFVVGQLVRGFTREARDAGFEITEDDRVVVVPSEDGLRVDFDWLYRDIVETVQEKSGGTVAVRLAHVVPQHTEDEVRAMGITGKIAEYTTYFDPKLVDRSYNVSVAASAINNLLVAPGETVSFNEIVGPRSLEQGYRNAPIIIENEFQDGMGGGVCQVSSTLYNAVLLANLEIVERSHHSLPVAYVPIGRDATVVYGHIDFKFRNPDPTYVYIRSEIGKSHLTIKVFGRVRENRRVEIKSWVTQTFEPKVLREEDPNLEAGKEVVKRQGLRGYKAEAERWVWDDGKLHKEKLPSSYYHPLDKIVAVGVKAQPTTISPPADMQIPETVLPPAAEEPPPAAGREETDR
ncbi:MAG: VanW family protein [Bacillota bacterium]